jgi:hypothetical protein
MATGGRCCENRGKPSPRSRAPKPRPARLRPRRSPAPASGNVTREACSRPATGRRTASSPPPPVRDI